MPGSREKRTGTGIGSRVGEEAEAEACASFEARGDPPADIDVGRIVSIPLSRLRVADCNARKDITLDDSTTVADLASDISRHGLLHPLTVRRLSPAARSPAAQEYEIIAGQRRYSALRLLGRTTAQCNVIRCDDLAAEEISLIENVQRAKLGVADRVRSYARLYECYDRNMAQLAEAVSVSLPTVRTYIRVAGLPAELLGRLDRKGAGRLTLSTAKEIAAAPAEHAVAVADAVAGLKNNAERAVAARAAVLHARSVVEINKTLPPSRRRKLALARVIKSSLSRHNKSKACGRHGDEQTELGITGRDNRPLKVPNDLLPEIREAVERLLAEHGVAFAD